MQAVLLVAAITSIVTLRGSCLCRRRLRRTPASGGSGAAQGVEMAQLLLAYHVRADPFLGAALRSRPFILIASNSPRSRPHSRSPSLR